MSETQELYIRYYNNYDLYFLNYPIKNNVGSPTFISHLIAASALVWLFVFPVILEEILIRLGQWLANHSPSARSGPLPIFVPAKKSCLLPNGWKNLQNIWDTCKLYDIQISVSIEHFENTNTNKNHLFMFFLACGCLHQ